MALFQIVNPDDEYAALAASAVPVDERVSYDQLANTFNITAISGTLVVKIAQKHVGKVAGEFTKRGLNRNTDFAVVGVNGSKGEAVVITRLTDAKAVNTPKTRTRKPKAAPPIPAEDAAE